jgi:hypothetical protein
VGVHLSNPKTEKKNCNVLIEYSASCGDSFINMLYFLVSLKTLLRGVESGLFSWQAKTGDLGGRGGGGGGG